MGNFGTFEFCALKLGNVPNLYAQKLIVPKYCQGLKKVYKFGKVPNLNAQIRQVAKFVRTNLAHCQICTLLQGRGKKVYKFGKVPNLCAQFWHFARFVRGPLLNNYYIPYPPKRAYSQMVLICTFCTRKYPFLITTIFSKDDL